MTIDLDELRQKKAFEELAASRESSAEEVTTAFLVVQSKDGQWAAYHDFADLELDMRHAATFDDMIGGCENIKIGCQIQQTGMATMIVMEQRAAQMQQQLAQQQEANRVASLIDPKKLRA